MCHTWTTTSVVLAPTSGCKLGRDAATWLPFTQQRTNSCAPSAAVSLSRTSVKRDAFVLVPRLGSSSKMLFPAADFTSKQRAADLLWARGTILNTSSFGEAVRC